MGGIVVADRTLSLLWDATRLRLLVEIDRRGSVSAAAREVGIGQSSASEHLRLLETAAGQRLVERNGRGSRLTEAGRVLAASASQALATPATGEVVERLLAGRIQLALVGETTVDERIALEPFLADEIVGIAKPGVLSIR